MANILVDRSGENRIVLGPGANRLISTTQVEEAFRAGPAPSLVLSQVAIATGARPDDAVLTTAGCCRHQMRLALPRGEVTQCRPASGRSVSMMFTVEEW